MNNLIKIYTFGVKTYRVTKFLIVELWHAIRYVTQETIEGFRHVGRYWPYYTITVLVITTYWPAIQDYTALLDLPKVTFASEIIRPKVEVTVIKEGRFEEILAEEEARVFAEKEPTLKQEALLSAKERFDEEVLKLQLGLPLE
jgi:hypothetical protein